MSTDFIIDLLSSTFADLTDPTRYAQLATGEAPINELAAPFDMRSPALSKHDEVLEIAGLITKARDAQRRQYSSADASLQPGDGLNWSLPTFLGKPIKPAGPAEHLFTHPAAMNYNHHT